MVTKICSICDQELPIALFQKDTQKSDGIRPWCKPCRKAREKSYRDKWKKDRAGIPEPQDKRCSKCLLIKPIVNFARDACRPDGFHVWCKACRSPLEKKIRENFRARHPERYQQEKRNVVYKKYGITKERYYAILSSQGNGCAICGTFYPSKKRPNLDIDHCHKTGKVRGLLCGTCNRGVGQMRDDPHLLRAAAAYLERNR